MPRRPDTPDALRGRVFRGSTVVKLDLLTPDQLRSSAWRRVRRDVYADARLPVDHGLAISACTLALPKGALIAGRSAAWLYGVKQAGADQPVDVLLSDTAAWWSATGVSIHMQGITDDDSTTLDWHRLTTPNRTCLDIARWYDAPVAVQIIDAMLASRLVRQPDLLERLGRTTGHGIGRAQETLALCDGRAESPPESVLRVRLILAGLPAPVPQFEVWWQGQFIARVDLGWPAEKIAVEYDGAWHGAAGQLGRDRRRLNALVAAGWTVIHVTAADMHDLRPVIRQLSNFLQKSA